MNASIHLGLQLGGAGREFNGSHQTKGCHATDGMAFFGEGGQDVEKKTTLLYPHYRPNGYDCGIIITTLNTNILSCIQSKTLVIRIQINEYYYRFRSMSAQSMPEWRHMCVFKSN